MDVEQQAGTVNLEPEEVTHYFFGCCWERPITKNAITVAYISLVSAISNLVIMFIAQENGGFHVGLDSFLLLIEFICILTLFYGVSHKRPGHLKPYMICGCIWNGFLLLLWLACVIQLFDRDRFTIEVVNNLSKLIDIDPNDSAGMWTSTILVALLGVIIVIGWWFVYIIFLTYSYFLNREDFIWSQQPETKRLINTELSLSTDKQTFVNRQIRL